METKKGKEEEKEFDGDLPKGWKYFGFGKFKDSYDNIFWMCGNCLKMFKSERSYNYHMSAVKCKEEKSHSQTAVTAEEEIKRGTTEVVSKR